MSFSYEYTVQFRDTDAAGVVYFASILSICHIAYEASLIRSGIDLKLFVNNSEFAVPIFNVSADFFKPLYCGDRAIIKLIPQQIDSHKFEINYEIVVSNDKSVDRSLISATVKTQHIVINPQSRNRREFPELIFNWLLQWG